MSDLPKLVYMKSNLIFSESNWLIIVTDCEYLKHTYSCTNKW